MINQSIPPLEDIQRAIRRREREEDILQWGKYYFPEKFTQEFCEELHNYLVDIRKDPFTCTLAPRNHAKTTIKCFLIPIYQALVEPHTFTHYLNIQNTSSKAVSINLSIRSELELNEKLRDDYGDQVDNIKWTEKQFALKNGIVFTAIGAGESVRGINYKNRRPDYIIGDDIYDEDDINNINRIKKKESWFWSSIYPARAQDRLTSIHIQGTAINKNDLMHKLSKDKKVKYRKFKAVLNDSTKETLWFDYDQLMIDKEFMGSLIFAREMQNECRDDATSIIRESWIKYYEGVIPEEEKVIERRGNIDPAIGEKSVNDCTGKAAIYKTNLENYYIEDIRNDRYSFNKNLIDIKNFHAKHSFTLLKIEGIAAFKAFTQELRRTTSLPIRELISVKDKISRLESISYLFENGKVYINKKIPKPLRDELVYQLINNEPNHDDIRDAVVMGLEEDKTVLRIRQL